MDRIMNRYVIYSLSAICLVLSIEFFVSFVSMEQQADSVMHQQLAYSQLSIASLWFGLFVLLLACDQIILMVEKIIATIYVYKRVAISIETRAEDIAADVAWCKEKLTLKEQYLQQLRSSNCKPRSIY